MNHSTVKIGWSTDFIVVSAEAPSVEQLHRVQKSGAQWVVVEREGGRWRYVFHRNEVLQHPYLKELLTQPANSNLITLEEALDLHETQSSAQINPGEKVTSPVDNTLRLPATRYVEVEGGKPVAIGGPDINPTRKKRSMLAQPRSGLNFKLGGGPAVNGPIQESVEEKLGPDGVSIITVFPESMALPRAKPAEHDEGTIPIRHPSIEAEGDLRPGAEFTLVVDLLCNASTMTSGGPLQIGPLEAGWRTFELDVTVVSTDIDFADSGRSKVTIRRNQSSLPAHIKGVVHHDVLDGNEIEVKAQFWDGTRYCGAGRRRFQTAETAASAMPTPSPQTQGRVEVDPDAEKADLSVYITPLPGGSGGLLLWRMMTPRFDGLPLQLHDTIDLGNHAAAEAATMFKQFATLERGKHCARIEGFGEKLWQRAPTKFHEVYWALHDHYQRPLTIQFISGEPHLPWELMRPYRGKEAHEPLALRHAVARWIEDYDGTPRNRLPAGRLVTIAPHYKSAKYQLSLAEVTAAKLVQQFRAERVAGTLTETTQLFEQPPDEPVALLYFTGHGLFNENTADASAIKLEDGNLAVDEVRRREVKLGERYGTVVFFNACEVGATTSVLGAIGGWADAFASRKFRAFIAPLWAIDEVDASKATMELMTRIVTDRMPLGAALRDLRAAYGHVSPTFYSYLLYGDVTARLGTAIQA